MAPWQNSVAHVVSKIFFWMSLAKVAPGDPDHSCLMLKIEGHLGPNEGVPMPLVGGPLPQSDIETIRRWIAAGASDTAPF